MLSRIARLHLWIAAALAAIVVCTGLIWSTRVAAGADAYGYVTPIARVPHPETVARSQVTPDAWIRP